MSAGRSVIPDSGDQVWRLPRLRRAILLGNLAFDAALVITIVVWCSA